MFDSNAVFENPVTTVDQVIRSAFRILIAQWKTLVAIALGKMVSITLLVFLFALTLIAWVGPAFRCVFTGDYHARNLADHLIGAPSSGYRLLYDSYDSFGNFDDVDDVDDDDLNGCFATTLNQLRDNQSEFYGLLLVFLACIILVSSIFDGTMIHALAHTYIGHLPSISNSFKYGFKRMCGILTFNGLCASIIFISYFLTIGMVILLSDNYNIGLLFLCSMMLAIFVFLFSITMVAGIPSIVIEGHSAISAIPRSYYLCKDSICSIFCTIFCFNLLVLVTNAIFTSLRTGQVGFIAVLLAIVSFAISTVFSILYVAITVVLYISLRARSEQLTQEKMAEELGDCVATPIDYKYKATEKEAIEIAPIV